MRGRDAFCNTKQERAKAQTVVRVRQAVVVAATSGAQRIVAATTVLMATATAADNQVTVRGAYYKERATRVVQPMVDVEHSVGEDGVADAHFAVDAITSASVSAGAAGTAFTERRVEGGLGYNHRFDWLTLGGSARYSTEPDYRARTGSVRARLALAEENSIVDVGISGSYDSLSNAGAQGPFSSLIEGTVQLAMGSVAFTQVVDPNTVASISYDVSRLEGFLQNPYRTAITADGLVAERHPDLRYRHAAAISGRRYIDMLSGTFIASYRYYQDSWGIRAHTPDARFVLSVTDDVDATLRYRAYWQTAADFYARVYNSSDPAVHAFVTDDPKMANFSVHTLEAKLGLTLRTFGLTNRLGDMRVEGLLQYAAQSSRFSNAIVAQTALIVPL